MQWSKEKYWHGLHPFKNKIRHCKPNSFVLLLGNWYSMYTIDKKTTIIIPHLLMKDKTVNRMYLWLLLWTLILADVFGAKWTQLEAYQVRLFLKIIKKVTVKRKKKSANGIGTSLSGIDAATFAKCYQESEVSH